MFVTATGTATPAARYTKAQCWEAFRASEWFGRLDRRSHAIAELVLLRDNGIEARHLAVDSLAEVFAIDPDTLHRRFQTHAPALAASAGARALREAGLAPEAIDAVIVSTCTGYLCPGLSGYVVERLGLRADTQAYDLVGQGCAAALPNCTLAEALVAAGRCEHVLTVCVEVASAAMYLDDDPGVLVSACLFGDGAGALVLSRDAMPGRRRVEWKASSTLVEPAARDALRFEQRGGMLRNVLTRPVPRLAAEAAGRVLAAVLPQAGVRRSDIRAWIVHAGGRDVLQALARELALRPDALRYSAAMLESYGNLSSAFVIFVLQAALADGAEGGWWWMASFGAGFTSCGALLEVGC